jgi:hypothetical protein
MRDLMTNTVIPTCASLRDELNKWLVPRFGENVYIDFDITALPEMQQDMERMSRILRDANWLTYDEKRVAMNYEELGGAYATSYVSNGLIPIDQVLMDLTMTDGTQNDIIDNNGSADMGNGHDAVSQDTNGANVQNGAANENGS